MLQRVHVRLTNVRQLQQTCGKGSHGETSASSRASYIGNNTRLHCVRYAYASIIDSHHVHTIMHSHFLCIYAHSPFSCQHCVRSVMIANKPMCYFTRIARTAVSSASSSRLWVFVCMCDRVWVSAYKHIMIIFSSTHTGKPNTRTTTHRLNEPTATDTQARSSTVLGEWEIVCAQRCFVCMCVCPQRATPCIIREHSILLCTTVHLNTPRMKHTHAHRLRVGGASHARRNTMLLLLQILESVDSSIMI